MLQQFLNNNFIQITDDQNLNKLKKASDEILKKLNKDKSKIIEYSLVAIDPDIPADNEIIIEVKNIIIKHWNTFGSNAKDTPIVYIRAVILEAMEGAVKEKTNALIVWFGLRNFITKFNLNGKEKELIVEFLLGIGNKIEEEAIQAWSQPSEAKLEKLTFELKPLNNNLIDATLLTKDLKAASIHKDWGDGGENPIYPSQNDASWAKFFSERGATGIAQVINEALKQKTKDITTNFNQVQEKLNAAVVNIQEELLLRNALFQIRTNLLWWKEAGYSNALNSGYSSSKHGVMHLAIAKDYAQYIPCVYPVSVEFFLLEALKTFSTTSGTQTKLSEFLDTIASDLDSAKKIFKEPVPTNNRQSLISFIAGFVYGKYKADQIKALVGLPLSTQIPIADLTLWLFHDNQVQKLINTK